MNHICKKHTHTSDNGACCLFVGNHRSGFRKQGAEERNENILETTQELTKVYLSVMWILVRKHQQQ